MRGRLLALLTLLGAVAVAHADYVVIIANLNARPEGASGGTTPGAGGMLGGAPGMLGGAPGVAGPAGMLGGSPGMIGGGPPPGGIPGIGGGPPPGGIPGMGGAPGGVPGMGGILGGMMGIPGMNAEDAADDAPYIIVTVLEVQDLAQRNKLFKAGQPITFNHRWGKTPLYNKTYLYEVIPLEASNGRLLPSVSRRFQQKFEQAVSTKATTDQMIKNVALWALECGLVDDFTKVMDKLAETDKEHKAVKTYLKIKADLAKPIANDDVAARFKGRLLDGYRVLQADNQHFAILHNLGADSEPELKQHLARLEKTFKSFYYWWALKGIALPLPKERQIAVLTEKGDDFRRLKQHLTASPILADSFSARREGLAVFSSKRTDESYVTLDRIAKPEWDKGFVRHELLSGVGSRGMPKGTVPQLALIPKTYALLLKALEDEWEATGVSHEASRQLVFASGLLPRNVNVPEWIQFGLGSFFEVPLQSPWGGAGAASPYWMPRFRESYKAKHYNKDRNAAPNPYDALVRVVTDAGFRSKPDPGETAETHLRRARAAAWSLTYFLAQSETTREGLLRYFKELSRMPRDVELDDQVLLACFARSFDCVNPDRSINRARLTALAARWVRFIDDTPLEAETIHKKIRDYYKQVTKTPTQGNQPGRPGGGGPGGLIPGLPGGAGGIPGLPGGRP